uniref:Zinc finger GRF-type domain-containing protein n=1 Tax=Oryza sativa subsp. japonica TaxID=39947 RepID=Q6YV86_ORYSJ|nr:hypothetical protein [Oryza sativa Japonica Group]BAD17680.1 hypothetical protein [Oryza sativa Japonica Group]
MEASYTSGGGRCAISRRCRVPLVAPSIPELKCACGHAVAVQTSNTPRNPRRRWLQCPGENCRCALWIWEDLLNEYVEEMLSKEYIRVQVTHGIDEIGGIEPLRSIPSIGNFAAHDDVAGELAIFRGTSTSWVVVAGAISLAPVVVAGAAPIAVGKLRFADNGEWGMGNRDG